MSAFLLPSRTRLRFSSALLMACAVGCGARVDLGGSPPTPPPDTGPADDGSAATLLRFNDTVGGCVGVGVDDNHLYFTTYERGDAGSPIPSVHRCRKADCAATLTRVARPPCANCYYNRIERVGDRIGFATTPSEMGGWFHIAACTPPDCSDLQRVVGEFTALDSVAFGDGHVYFSISSDNTIYGCGFPSCTEGPRSFVPGSWSDQLATTGEWVYWIERAETGGTVKRKRRDGTSAAEALDLGAVLRPLGDGGTGLNGTVAHRIAAQDGWLYALVSNEGDPEIACGKGFGACVIARWPDDALGKPRELVYRSAVPISQSPGPIDTSQSRIRLFDGRLVFAVEQAYSCDPANCSATLRPHGDFNTDRMASDGDYLYWCTTTLPYGQGELRRSARLQR